MERNVILDCRTIFEAASRPSMSERAYRKLSVPGWLVPQHPLWPIIAEQDRLFSGSSVVWGAVAGANDLLFEPGPEDSPAAVVYATGTDFDDTPGALREVADRTGGLPEESDDPALAAFARFVASSTPLATKVPIPASLTANVPLYYAMIVVARKHLPDGVLTKDLVPLLINPGVTTAATILPSRYWSPEMLDYWTDV